MVDYPDEQGPMNNWPKVEAVEGAFELLYILSRRAECHVATNAKDSSDILIGGALNRVGLVQFIKKIFCFQSIGFEKPSSEFFDAILSSLKCSRDEIVMIGDNLRKDVYGARNYGIDAIWYNRSNDPVPEGIVSVSSLTMLLK